MKEIIKNLYQKLQNTKVHLWSHIMALVGWIYILIIFGDTKDDLFLFMVGILAIFLYLFVPNIIFYLIENFCIKKSIINSNFLIKNRFYNIIWLIGQIGVITGITILIFVFIIIFLKYR